MIILTFTICSNTFGQVKLGTYRQGDTMQYADLKIFPNHKFSFYDTRYSSCWLWSKYEGNWTVNKDTLVFSWQSFWEEDAIQEEKSIDRAGETISLIFKYDDGEPIPNVKVCYSCDWLQNCTYSYTDNNGKVSLPRERLTDYQGTLCTDTVRRLTYEIKSKFIEFSSSRQQDTASNVFVITVKKHRKSGRVTERRKFLITNDRLVYIDADEQNLFKNWGNFSFLTKKYIR